MKLKEFDFKLPNEEKRRKKIILTSISLITVMLIITIASTFAYYQSIESQNPINSEVGTFSSGDIIFAVTIDGVESQTFPTKEGGYVAKNVNCDKGASAIWDNNLWNIEVGNITQSKTTCNINFISETGTLNYEILAQFGGKVAIVEAPTNTFTSISQTTDKLMYKMGDDYGISYYYRGARTLLNNNLIFAGFQWKITRINGDGTIRIMYNGTEEQYNQSGTVNMNGTNTQIIGTYAYNTNYLDNKYIGYMYGGTNGTASTSRVQAITNTTSSTTKVQLDNWYATNIANKESGVTSKIVDRIFCNDRQLRSEVGGGATGAGYGTISTIYASSYRLFANKIPTLKCGQKNDRFTVNENAKGNGSLTYPIGIITADEVALAGGIVGTGNSTYYLFTNQYYWTLSPIDYDGLSARVWIVYRSGELAVDNSYDLIGLRPYLTLDSNLQVTGSGSATDPFKVIT